MTNTDTITQEQAVRLAEYCEFITNVPASIEHVADSVEQIDEDDNFVRFLWRGGIDEHEPDCWFKTWPGARALIEKLDSDGFDVEFNSSETGINATIFTRVPIGIEGNYGLRFVNRIATRRFAPLAIAHATLQALELEEIAVGGEESGDE